MQDNQQADVKEQISCSKTRSGKNRPMLLLLNPVVNHSLQYSNPTQAQRFVRENKLSEEGVDHIEQGTSSQVRKFLILYLQRIHEHMKRYKLPTLQPGCEGM